MDRQDIKKIMMELEFQPYLTKEEKNRLLNLRKKIVFSDCNKIDKKIGKLTDFLFY